MFDQERKRRLFVNVEEYMLERVGFGSLDYRLRQTRVDAVQVETTWEGTSGSASNSA